MEERVFIGYVICKADNEKLPVSASPLKRLAGEAMEDWIKENDPDQLDYLQGAVFSASVPIIR